MSTKTKKTAAEAAEETTEIKAAQEAAEDGQNPANAGDSEEKEQKRAEQLKAFLDKLPDRCVYCGPSVRGVARQYAVYSGGIPDVLKEFILEHPAARGLVVSVDRFAKMRVRLETPGTAESILFNKVRAAL